MGMLGEKGRSSSRQGRVQEDEKKTDSKWTMEPTAWIFYWNTVQVLVEVFSLVPEAFKGEMPEWTMGVVGLDLPFIYLFFLIFRGKG